MRPTVPAAITANQNTGSPGVSSPESDGTTTGATVVTAVASGVAFGVAPRNAPPYLRSGDATHAPMAQAPAPAAKIVSVTYSTAALVRVTAGLTSTVCRNSDAAPRSTVSRKEFSTAKSWHQKPNTLPMSTL